MKNQAIGGYFELEQIHLDKSEHYHKNALRLNTGRCALEYVLRSKRYRKVYIPYYTCDVILEPILKLGLKYEFYHVDSFLDPIFDKQVATDEVFLYTNYYGIKQKTVERVAKKIKNIVIDNSQAFFAPPLVGVDTFYSPRKFFGVPDGAYLYTDKYIREELLQDCSHERMSHLLKRLELGAESGYADFCYNSQLLVGQPIKIMSQITDLLLRSINYEAVEARRNRNFMVLDKQLRLVNGLKFDDLENAVPMAYPYFCHRVDIRHKLIENKIFVAKYWPNISTWIEHGIEIDLMKNLLSLPIDQRYQEQNMLEILEVLKMSNAI